MFLSCVEEVLVCLEVFIVYLLLLGFLVLVLRLLVLGRLAPALFFRLANLFW